MTELQRYLAEEIAEDHADGLVCGVRRCGGWDCSDRAGPRPRRCAVGFLADEARARGVSSPGPEQRRRARLEPRSRRGRRARSCFAARRPKAHGRGAAGPPRGGVLVIHENRGLTDSIRTIAGRLAGSGYSALAIDLLSEEGGTASFSDEFEAMAALERHPPRGSWRT